QELCDVCAVSYAQVTRAARLLEGDVRVVSLEPRGIEDILEHVLLVGRLTGTEERAQKVVADARARLQALRDATRDRPRPRVVCIEWLDPIFAAGHWVPEQVQAAGGEELIGRRGQPSREVTWDTVLEARPDFLVLMPCGMPIDRTLGEIDALTSRPGWQDLPAVRGGRVYVVDASSYFNRPGPRVIRGAEILFHLLHPGAHPPCEPPSPDEAQLTHGYNAPMRPPVDERRLRGFLERFGALVSGEGRLYLTGGATALLHGWRDTTVDIDLSLDPEPTGAFEAIRQLKDELGVNVELASPADFLPTLPGWRERSLFVGRFGTIDVYHYDPYSQALGKIERGYDRDLADVREMLDRGLIDTVRLRELYAEIRSQLIRFPAVEPGALDARVREVLDD
ncbi:MAG: ABC transporter substrate-binding protein, partial [Thermoanaerobaculia bacterium]